MVQPVVVAYRDTWPEEFADEARALSSAVGHLLDGPVEHIGSTAIPAMAAKPQIDMMAPVSDLAVGARAALALAGAGYVRRVHRTDAVLVVRATADPVDLDSVGSHSLHLTTRDSDLWTERLLFRDRLRDSAELRARYLELKQAMLGADAPYRSADKRDFVREVLAGAGHALRDDLRQP